MTKGLPNKSEKLPCVGGAEIRLRRFGYCVARRRTLPSSPPPRLRRPVCGRRPCFPQGDSRTPTAHGTGSHPHPTPRRAPRGATPSAEHCITWGRGARGARGKCLNIGAPGERHVGRGGEHVPRAAQTPNPSVIPPSSTRLTTRWLHKSCWEQPSARHK